MLLTLVTPEKRVVIDHEISELIVPAYAGQLDILPGHAPLMTTLGVGTLKYRDKGSSEFHEVAIGWGYCEVNPAGVLILAETAETKEQIDVERAQQALKKAEQMLGQKDLEPDQILSFQKKMAIAKARIELARGTSSKMTH